MTKLSFLRKHGKKTGIALAVASSAIFITGISLFCAGGTAKASLVSTSSTTNAEYADNSALNFDKSSTFAALNNQFKTMGVKLFDIELVGGNAIVSRSVNSFSASTVILSNNYSYVSWIKSNSQSFVEYFNSYNTLIQKIQDETVRAAAISAYDFEYGLTLAAANNFDLFLAGAILFPLGIAFAIPTTLLLVKSKHY